MGTCFRVFDRSSTKMKISLVCVLLLGCVCLASAMPADEAPSAVSRSRRGLWESFTSTLNDLKEKVNKLGDNIKSTFTKESLQSAKKDIQEKLNKLGKTIKEVDLKDVKEKTGAKIKELTGNAKEKFNKLTDAAKTKMCKAECDSSKLSAIDLGCKCKN